MTDHVQQSAPMRDGIRRFVIIVAFLGELIVLAMFYSATLLDPLPFDWVRVSMILLTGIVSCVLAYTSSARFLGGTERNAIKWKQVLLKPPFLVWFVAVAFTAIQFSSAALMWFLATRR